MNFSRFLNPLLIIFPFSLEMSKRQPAFNNNTAKTTKRKSLSPAERHMKKMLGEIPLMRITPNQSTPKKQVLKKLNAIVETGLITRKQIAVENGLRYAKLYIILFKH
jgi:hypothetical protein